jgi:hypothetical protein
MRLGVPFMLRIHMPDTFRSRRRAPTGIQVATFRLVMSLLLSGCVICMSPRSALAVGELFVARPPYAPEIAGVGYPVDLAHRPRSFDFGGDVPFINPATRVSDIATINLWNDAVGGAEVLNSNAIGRDGAGSRVFRRDGYTAIGCSAGDGLVEGALRTQINSYPIPARRRFVWDLSVRFAGLPFSENWVATPTGMSPATVWQLKSPGLPPAMVMVVDTDPQDSTRLTLHFDVRPNHQWPAYRIGTVTGLVASSDIDVFIDGYLDERLPASGGRGYWRVLVNGAQVLNVPGPTLQLAATRPYTWSIGMYLYRNKTPVNFSRFAYWRRARLIEH